MDNFSSGFEAAVLAAKNAWERMENILFQPFNVGKWFVLGFAAWLATLGEQGGGGFNNVGRIADAFKKNGTEGGSSKPDMNQIVQPVKDWCAEHSAIMTWIVIAVIVVVLLFIAVGVVICWLNSRGKFMLLDNVVRNDQRIAEPWTEFRTEGNSLFWWRFWYGLCVQLPLALLWLGGTVWFIAVSAGYEWNGLSRLGLKGWLMVALLAFVLMIPMLLAAFPPAFLKAFGVPLMYKYRITASAALAYAWKLFKARWKWFVAYFVLGIGIGMAWVLAIAAAVLVTCCIAGCLMAIPYLGAVLLLPMTVFYMAWRVHFLELVHPELQIFLPPPVPPSMSVDTPAPVAPTGAE